MVPIDNLMTRHIDNEAELLADMSTGERAALAQLLMRLALRLEHTSDTTND